MNKCRWEGAALTALTALVLVFSGSCMLLTETAGRFLDGSAFAAKKITERYRSVSGDMDLRRGFFNGTEGLELTLKTQPGLTLYLSVSQEPEAVYLYGCHFLASGVSGWNEFTLDLAGGGSFSPLLVSGDDPEYILTLADIEVIDISAGKIRNGDTSLSGGQALSVLRSRGERLAAMAEWMHGRAAAAGPPAFDTPSSFAAYWKPLLLPETVSWKDRPPEYKTEVPVSGKPWAAAEDIRWNLSYTAEMFPEDLGALRNQGAFLRDWEEALPWLYLVYRWDDIVQMIAETAFKRIK
jgi:hypothetical protein